MTLCSNQGLRLRVYLRPIRSIRTWSFSIHTYINNKIIGFIVLSKHSCVTIKTNFSTQIIRFDKN